MSSAPAGDRMVSWHLATGSMRKQAALGGLRPAATSVVVVLLLSVPLAAAQNAPGYVGERIDSAARTSRASVQFALPPDEWPYRGMLVATGNVLSPLARWIAIDLELTTIRQVMTHLADAGGLVAIDSERTHAISDHER